MDLLGGGAPTSIPDGDATYTAAKGTDFGSEKCNVGSSAQTFTISNTAGTSPLNLLAASPFVAISGASAADYSLTRAPASPVAAGGTDTFVLTWSPSGSAVGNRDATITISNDDVDVVGITSRDYVFSVRGTATGGAALVCGCGVFCS
jgi:hypothetical protein